MKNNKNYESIQLPTKVKVVYESGNKSTIRIWDAIYNGLPCYCVEHKPTGHMEIIDHDDAVLNAIQTKISRAGWLVIDKNSINRFLRFAKGGGERSITFRLFVFAQYNGIETSKMRRAEISLYDRSLLDFDIIDLRASNLYNASEFCPVKNGWEVSTLSVAGVENSIIQVKVEKHGAVEFLDYSPEMLLMLGTGSICNPSYNRSGKRMAVGVQTGTGKSITMNLSRFAGLFGKYFENYKSGCNPIASFVHDLPKLTAETPEQFDHINACKFNNCLANLFPTEGTINQRKSNSYRKFQTGGVKAVAVTNERGEIFIEAQTLDKSKVYYKCKTAEDFLDWQKVFLGADKLTENTRIIDWKKRCWCWMKNLFSKPIDEASIEEKQSEIKDWCMDRDRVLALAESAAVEFRDYTQSGVRHFYLPMVPNAAGESVVQIAGKELEFLGQKLPEGTVVVITNLGNAEGNGVTVG